MNFWKRYFCPFCVSRGKSPDRKGKLYINERIKRYNCFRCGANGSTDTLNYSSLVAYHGTAYSAPIEASIWDNRRFVPFTLAEIEKKFPQIFSFLKRKNALSLFTEVNLVFGDEIIGLVLPIKDNQVQIKVFSLSEGTSKYLSNPGFNKNKNVLGLEEIQGSLVCIVEGYLDFIRLPHRAVTVFGRVLSKSLIDRLLIRDIEKFVILWDADSHDESLKDAFELWKTYDIDSYAGFMLDGSPSDSVTLFETPCLRIKDQSFSKLKDLIEEDFKC